MLISKIAIQRPVFTSMVMAALIVFGFISYQRLGVDLFPRVEFPIVTILTELPGADPQTIETTVTDPVEEAVNTISGIKHLRSTSAENMSQVAVEFTLDKDIDVAFQEITARIASIRSRLPEEIEEPVIEKFDADASPILSIIVAGDLPERELGRLADKTVKERIQHIRDVGSVRLVGFRDRKMWLWLQRDALERQSLAMNDVIDALKREHVEIPGGRVSTGKSDISTKLEAEFDRAEQFDDLIVADRAGGSIKLKDIGHAEDGLEEERSRARLDGKPCIALQVRRQSGTNAVEVSDAVVAEVEKMRTELKPLGVRLEFAEEQAPFIKHAVNDVKRHLTMGGLLAVSIVLLFLLNFRSTFISSLVLPTSIIATFMMMAAMGFTLNMMTMLGLTLAIGLLIDDAIVVQENIMRHVEEGMPAREAAYFATNEIGLAVLATTLSVVSVFVPVAFMRGLVGRFFESFALTVTVAVLISMVISFTLDPMLSSRLLVKPKKKNFVFRALESGFRRLELAYEHVLRFCLRFRSLVVLFAIGCLASIFMLAGSLRFEFVPVEDQSEFNVKVRAPLGSSVDATSELMERVVAHVKDLPEKEYAFYTVGADELSRANEGKLYVKLVPKDARERNQAEIMEAVRKSLADVKDGIISVEIVPRISGGGRRWAQLQFELRGPELTELDRISRGLQEKMKAAGGYVDVDSSFETGKPEVDVRMQRDRAADLGVSPVGVGQTLRAAIGGLEIGTFKADNDRYDVAVRLLENDRKSPEQIESLRVRSRFGNLVELRNIANIERIAAPVEISRYNRQRQITVLANLSGKVLGDATIEIDRFAKDLGIPPGYQTGWTGFADTMQEAVGNAPLTLLLALIVIYMVLASQFESLIHPFTIMLTLPLAFIGAFAALLIFKQTISLYVFLGIVFLMGLVTKNAILLVDFANTLRKRDGLDASSALLKAGPVRLRPILMTTVAMIAGMLPVALGNGVGSESRKPMAISVIGGLISSTLLTLIVVPVFYSLFDQMVGFFRRIVRRLLGRPQDSPNPPVEVAAPNELAATEKDVHAETSLTSDGGP